MLSDSRALGLLVARMLASSIRIIRCLAYEAAEERARKVVITPTELGMPLHPQREAIPTRILETLHQAVSRPCGRHEIFAHRIHCLVMVAVYEGGLALCELGENRSLKQPHAVRAPITRCTLLVLDRFRQLRSNVLDQSSTSRNVPCLHPKTDR